MVGWAGFASGGPLSWVDRLVRAGRFDVEDEAAAAVDAPQDLA
jgi:hypothetical protein